MSLLVGELFNGVNYKDNQNKIKTNIVLHYEISDNFSRITSFKVGHQKFNSGKATMKFLGNGFRNTFTFTWKTSWWKLLPCFLSPQLQQFYPHQ